ncbi:MAG: PAS domain-containing protein [Myxococcales bacterium]|nr:PAS domain-containing protein [Myxococcales bacterium]
MPRDPGATSGLPRGLVDSLLEGCQIIGPDFRYLYVNDATTLHGRTTRAALLGRTMMECYPGIEQTAMFAELRACLGDGVPRRLDNDFVFPDGSRGTFELRFVPVPDGVAILSVELTATRRADARIEHLNAVLRAIRNVNQLIAREHDSPELLARAAELMVESRGFATCAIVRQRGTSLELAAEAGEVEKLERIARVLGRGEVPACLHAALRDAAVICRRPATDCPACPVSEGFPADRSTLVARLECDGAVYGALLVSMAESLATDEETSLLAEVAQDLAFALRSRDLRRAEWRTQLALRDSERRYRALFESMTEGLAYCRVIEEDGRTVDFEYLEVNPAFERQTGLRDAAGKRVSELIPGIRASDPELFEIYGRVARSGRAEHFEHRVAALGQWFEVSAYCPSPGHFVAVFDVVTARKAAEQERARHAERMAALARAIQDLSRARSTAAVGDVVRQAARTLVGADGATFVVAEGALCHYLDEDAVAPLWKGRKFPLSACISGWAMLRQEQVAIERVRDDDRIPQDAYRGTFVESLVMTPVRADGPLAAIGVYWAAEHPATEEELGVLQALADSTAVAMENVRVLAELEESRARARALYDHLPSATFVWEHRDGELVLADWNEAARATLEPVSAAGRVAAGGELARLGPSLAADVAACLEARATVRREVECRLPGADGTRNLILSYGLVPGALVVLHAEDVTAERRAQERLAQAQQLDGIGHLAGGVAHDFNNLLAVILTNAGFALDGVEQGHPAREDVLEIQRAAERASALTRQLLAFSRKQVLQPVPLLLPEVIEGCRAMLGRLAGEHVELVVTCAPDTGRVEADRGQLEQVLMNLAVNARDAMPSGGTLTIETANVELDERDPLRPARARSGRFVRLAVGDTGRGMTPAVRERAFEPFFTTKDKGKGTGLGLSSVYGIVTQSGGSVDLWTEPGVGARVEIFLPRTDALALAAATAPGADLPRGSDRARGTETVLVVEDEEGVRRAAVRILRGAGYHVLAAANGGEAILLCERHRGAIRLLVTDVMMPLMSGPELAGRLATVVPNLRILFVSGYADDTLTEWGALGPGAHFIPKPFSAEALAQKVRAVLDA